MKPFVNFIPTKLYFGAGQLGMLGTIPLPGKKALIVITSGRSMRSSGTLDRVEKSSRTTTSAAPSYDKDPGQPDQRAVMEGAAFARREECDFVLGLGGGSPIDASKAIAVMAANPGDYWDYVSGGTGRAQPIPNPPLPIVAVTTTAGTGTEADPWTGRHQRQREDRLRLARPRSRKSRSSTPELMLTVPPQLTAFQGFDAFFHAAECYLANCATPVSELYSLKSIELICKSLPTAVRDGENLAARTDVALANTLSGMAESTSCCTSEHSLAHAIGGFHPNVPARRGADHDLEGVVQVLRAAGAEAVRRARESGPGRAISSARSTSSSATAASTGSRCPITASGAKSSRPSTRTPGRRWAASSTSTASR